MPEQSAEREIVRDPERHAHKCEDGCDDGPGHRQAQIRSPVERAEHRPRDRDEREPADQPSASNAAPVVSSASRADTACGRLTTIDPAYTTPTKVSTDGASRGRATICRMMTPATIARIRTTKNPSGRKTAGSASMMVNAAVARPIGGAMTAIATATSAITVSSGTLSIAVAPSSGIAIEQPRRRRPVGSPLHAVECPRAAAPQGARRHRLDEADVETAITGSGHPPAGGSSSDDGVAGLPRGHFTGGPRGTRER